MAWGVTIENIKTMKKFLIIPILICILFFLIGCKPYNSDDFIGLSSQQIVEEFGEFDNIGMPPNEDGLYCNCECGYVIAETKSGILGTISPELFMIRFDANSIAVRAQRKQPIWAQLKSPI